MAETRGGSLRVRLRRKGWPQVSIPVADADVAADLEGLLSRLVTLRRRDVLEAIAKGQLDPVAVSRATAVALPIATVSVEELERFERQEMAGQLGRDAAHTPSPGEPSAGELVDEWLRWLPSASPKARSIPYSAETISGYAAAWRFLFDWLGSRDWPLRRFDKKLLAEYRTARVNGGASPATVDRNVTSYASFARWVREHWEPEHNRTLWTPPAFPLLTRPSTEERYVPPTQFAEICAAINQGERSELYRSFYGCIRGSGMRIDEILWLRRMDVDLSRHVIRLRPHAERRLKSADASRDIPVPPELVSDWQAIAGEDRRQEARYLHPLLRDYDHVMGVWRRAVIRAGYHDEGAGQRARLRARIRQTVPGISDAELEKRVTDQTKGPLRYLAPDYNLHALRHSFGVACARAQLGTKNIAKLMGHASSATTEIYLEWAFGEAELSDLGAKIGANL